MKPSPAPETLILTLRQQKVILDSDLAALYGLPTKAFNQAVKRNAERFPPDFRFQLTREEAESVVRSRSQIVTLDSRSQIATLKRGQNIKYLPYAFTEHGAIMAATVLNSPQAVTMSLFVVRAFIKQREILLAQADVLTRLAQMDTLLLQHDDAIQVIWRELQPLLSPPPSPPTPEIGFHVKEAPPAYRIRKAAKKSRL